MALEKSGRSVAESRTLSRNDVPGSLQPEWRARGRLQVVREPMSDQPWSSGTTSESPAFPGLKRSLVQCIEVNPVACREMIEALGHAPGIRRFMPRTKFFGQTIRESCCIPLDRVELLLERFDVGRRVHAWIEYD